MYLWKGGGMKAITLILAILFLTVIPYEVKADISSHLYLIGDRWEFAPLAGFNVKDGKTIYRQVHVIGVWECDISCIQMLMTGCCKGRELYAVPFGETKWMTPEEAGDSK